MNLQDLGATEFIGIAILALAVVGFMKGLIRTVFALICLGVAGYAALWGNEHAHDFTASWSNAIPAIWLPKVVALISGLIVFFTCRYLLNFLVDPFNDSKAGKRVGFGLPAAALSLCAGLAILWLGLTGIRYAASLAELRDTQRMLLLEETNDTARQTSALLLKANFLISDSAIGKWQQQTDPLYASGKLALSKLLVMYHHKPTRKALLENPATRKLLNHPTFLELAYSDEIKSYAESGKPREIFNSTSVTKALDNPEFMKSFYLLDLHSFSSNNAH